MTVTSSKTLCKTSSRWKFQFWYITQLSIIRPAYQGHKDYLYIIKRNCPSKSVKKKKKKRCCFPFQIHNIRPNYDQTKPGDVSLIPLMKLTFLSEFTSIRGCLLHKGSDSECWASHQLVYTCSKGKMSSWEKALPSILRRNVKGSSRKKERKFAFALTYADFGSDC